MIWLLATLLLAASPALAAGAALLARRALAAQRLSGLKQVGAGTVMMAAWAASYSSEFLLLGRLPQIAGVLYGAVAFGLPFLTLCTLLGRRPPEGGGEQDEPGEPPWWPEFARALERESAARRHERPPVGV